MAMKVRSIPRAVREDFKAILALPDEKLKSLGQWIMERFDALSSTAEIDDAEVKTIANRLGISRAEVAKASSLVLNVLMGGDRPGELDLEFVNDLGLGDLAGKLRILLQSTGDTSSTDLVRIRQKGIALGSAIPTLEGIDVLCDLRAIFRSFASGNPSTTHSDEAKALLGFEPVVIIGLQLNDASGEDTSPVFQLSEEGLLNLIKTLGESLTQLQIVKDAALQNQTGTKR
jgi:hypothetical protein